MRATCVAIVNGNIGAGFTEAVDMKLSRIESG